MKYQNKVGVLFGLLLLFGNSAQSAVINASDDVISERTAQSDGMEVSAGDSAGSGKDNTPKCNTGPHPCAKKNVDETHQLTDDSIIADLIDAARRVNTKLQLIFSEIEQFLVLQITESEKLSNYLIAILLVFVGLILLLVIYVYRWVRMLFVRDKRISPGPEIISDGSALRDYLKRLIPVDLMVEDFMQDKGNDFESLKEIKLLIEDALDSCGVETFSPAIGEDYRRAEGVADYPKKQTTDKPEDDCKIAEVLEKGYKIQTAEGYEIIYPAKVRVFTTK